MDGGASDDGGGAEGAGRLDAGRADRAAHRQSAISLEVGTGSSCGASAAAEEPQRPPPAAGADEPPAEAEARVLREQFQISMTSLTRYEGDRYSAAFLKGRMAEIAVQRAASGSVWDTSHPFLSLLCKPWFPWLLAGMALYQAASLAACLRLLLGEGLVEGRRFRFTALALRDGSEPAAGGSEPASGGSGPGIASFGLLRDGCEDAFAGLGGNRTTWPDGRMTLEFAAPVAMNGWYFVTPGPAAPPGRDAVRFLLERSGDAAGDAWDAVASSSRVWAWDGSAAWGAGEHPTTRDRGAAEAFDLRTPWAWFGCRLACGALLAAMLALLCLASALKHYARGRGIAAGLAALHAAANAFGAVALAQGGMWAAAFVAGGGAVVDACFPLLLLSAERTLRRWLGLAGLAYPALVLVHHLALVPGPPAAAAARLVGGGGLALLRNSGLVEGLGYLGLFAVAQLTRRRSRRRALAIIRGDWAAYDRCWEALASDPRHRAALDEMLGFTERLRRRLPQYVRQPARPTAVADGERGGAAGPPADGGGRDGHESVEDGRLIHRLEQLFAQAAALDVHLRAKAKEWSLQSEGCFIVRPSHGRADALTDARTRRASPAGVRFRQRRRWEVALGQGLGK